MRLNRVKSLIKRIVQRDNDTIEKAIKRANVVSFDIFDTLISRRTYTPEDIFTIIGERFEIKNFTEKRVQADTIARTKLGRDINIDDIYDVLKSKYKIKNIEAVKEYEETLEVELCVPRKAVLELFNSLKEKSIPIILVSDMYLHEETIKKMLSKCGYSGYEHFYLSNKLNARKDTGTIWEIVKNDYPKKHILHIGDNDLSDVSLPQQYGIRTFHVKSGRKIAEEKNLYPSKNGIGDSIFWGTIINETLFNDPFSDNYQITNLEDLGFLLYGPLFYSFFHFIETQTKKGDQLLFLAREGYNLQKLYKKYTSYNKIAQHKNHYFLASRKATIFTNLDSIDSIYAVAQNNYYSGSLQNWFKQILNVHIEESDFDVTLPKDFETVKPIIDKNAKQIIAASKEAKKNYLSYIKQSVGKLDFSTKIIDLGYSGTIQYELSKMSKKPLCGIYLASSNSIKQIQDNSLSFLFDTRKNPDNIKLYEYSLILEFYLSAPFGQLDGFIKKSNKIIPKYNNEKMDSKKKQTITDIEHGIDKYLLQSAKTNKLFPSSYINTDALLNFYTYCVEQNLISHETKDLFSFTDNFTSDQTKNVFKIINKY